jgi:hypothetical protein
MRQAIPVIALVSLVLLITPLSALSDCAWVLWEKFDSFVPPSSGGDWEPIRAYATAEVCDAAKMKMWEQTAKAVKWKIDNGEAKSPVGMDGVSIGYLTHAGNLVNTSFKCLPDRVDPRTRR